MKKRRYWIPALMILLALAAIFGGAAGQKLSAKSRLTSALSQAFSQLETRFRDDPLLVLLETYDPEEKYTAALEAAANQEMLGTITYDMTVETNLKAHQLSAKGVAHTQNQEIGLSLYMDPDFIAVSSDELVAGEYYGITYDTFAADLRKIPLLNLIVSDTVLSRWDASLQSIRGYISREYPIPQIPQISKGEISKLLLGVAAMPCQLQKTDIVMGGKNLSCTELCYTISGEQVAWVLSRLTGNVYDSGSSFLFSFYLCEDALVRFSVSGMSEETPFRYCVDLNKNPLQDPLILTGSYGASQSLSVTVSTQCKENRYEEAWDIHTIEGGQEGDHSFSFDWNSQTGALEFRSSQLSHPLHLNFQKTENGLRIETQDLCSLFGLLLSEEVPSASRSRVPGSLTVSKGSAIETPTYRNLDQWSMQDFLTLLAGAGSLIGIRLE